MLTLETVIEDIWADWGNRKMDFAAENYRPAVESVEALALRLWELLHPGSGCHCGGSSRCYLSMLTADILYRMDELILPTFFNEPAPEEKSRETCLHFLRQIPRIREMLESDLEAFCKGDPAATGAAEVVASYPGYFAVGIYRLAHTLHGLTVPMLPRMLTEYAHSRTGIDIHPGAQIGAPFFIDHGTGVVIGETAKIGKNVKIYQGVTLGALSTRGGNSLRGKKRHPTIGNDVTIYAGASILGGDTVIGDGATIGSNVFLTGSVAPGQKVLPNPE